LSLLAAPNLAPELYTNLTLEPIYNSTLSIVALTLSISNPLVTCGINGISDNLF